MSAPTLYHLGAEYLALEALLQEAEDAGQALDGPEVAAILTRWFAELAGALEAKAARCVAIIREEEARAAAAKIEAKRLSELATRRATRAARVADALHAAMTLMQVQRVDTPIGTVTRAKNGGKAPLVLADGTDPDVVAVDHPDLVEVRTIINNDAVRAALAAGVALPFARLAERGEHIRIR